ncbi:MAG: hypothetical protein J5775_06040 [Spirochaetales bacterium]|nr:hypothetical protein [Spirochaetales bacterium]
MAYEIELKAHVDEEILDAVRKTLEDYPGSESLGAVSKFDMYWSQTDDGDPVFRTRREMTKDGPRVLFTAKPSKVKTEKGTEENQEFEFTAPDGQWDNILTFCSGLGLQVCRLKWKKGFGYRFMQDGFCIHAELLEVKYLGWFLEIEICPKSLDGFDVEAADRALRKVLAAAGIDESRVEPRGYNRMLRLCGREKG